MYFIWPRLRFFCSYLVLSSMPPKKKAAEKSEDHLEVETVDSELDIASPISSASSASTIYVVWEFVCRTVTTHFGDSAANYVGG